MQHAILILLTALLLTSCLGQGKRQAQRLERIYGMPMHEILAEERPKQIASRRQAGEHIEIAGEKPNTPKP